MPSQWRDCVRPAGVVPTPVVVCGSRSFKDYTVLHRYLDKVVYWLDDVVLYVGDCKKGVDALAVQWAQRNWYAYKIFYADWDSLGKAAGPVRNKEMIRQACEDHPKPLFVAIWDGESSGTKDCIRRARKRIHRRRVFVKLVV